RAAVGLGPQSVSAGGRDIAETSETTAAGSLSRQEAEPESAVLPRSFVLREVSRSMPRPSPGSLPPPRKPVSASVKSQTRQGGPASQPETPEDFRMLQQRIADAVSRQHRLCAAKQACEAELSRLNKTRRLNGHDAALASQYDDKM